MESEVEKAACFITDFVPLISAIVIITFIVGVIIGVVIAKQYGTLNISMESFIMVLSGIFLIAAIIFQSLGIFEEFASVVVTAFSSIIFSWLLTKTSGIAEWQKHEQELAMRSYRHINYIESASKTAAQTIETYIHSQDGKINPEQKLILSRAMDSIGYIQGGIRTYKMDWYDLMSDEEKTRFSPSEPANQVVDVSINQEDV